MGEVSDADRASRSVRCHETAIRDLARILTRILLERPELIGDVVFDQTCETLADLKLSYSRKELQKQIKGLLTRAQISAEDVRYDHDWRSELKPGVGFYVGGLREKLSREM